MPVNHTFIFVLRQRIYSSTSVYFRCFACGVTNGLLADRPWLQMSIWDERRLQSPESVSLHRQVHTHLDNSRRTWCIEFYDIRCRQIKSPGSWRSSYPHNGISYTGKMSSLYWIRPKSPRLWEAFVRDVYSLYKKDFIWSSMYQVNYVFVRYLSTTVHGISLIQLCYP